MEKSSIFCSRLWKPRPTFCRLGFVTVFLFLQAAGGEWENRPSKQHMESVRVTRDQRDLTGQGSDDVSPSLAIEASVVLIQTAYPWTLFQAAGMLSTHVQRSQRLFPNLWKSALSFHTGHVHCSVPSLGSQAWSVSAYHTSTSSSCVLQRYNIKCVNSKRKKTQLCIVVIQQMYRSGWCVFTPVWWFEHKVFLIGSPTGGAVCRDCRPFRCSLHWGRTLLGAGLEGYKPHPPPFTFSSFYVWREMWPLSFLFLLPYFQAMTDFYTPADINAFTKLLLLLVFYLDNTDMPRSSSGCSEQFSSFSAQHHPGFSSGSVSFGELAHRSKTTGQGCSASASSALHLTGSDLCVFSPMFSHWIHFILTSQLALNHSNLGLLSLVYLFHIYCTVNGFSKTVMLSDYFSVSL